MRRKFDDASKAEAVQSVKYASDPEVKRRKQAETLIPDRLNLENIFDIICFSTGAAQEVMQTLASSGIRIPIRVNRGWYFQPHKGP